MSEADLPAKPKRRAVATPPQDQWSEGYRRIADRVAELPAALREAERMTDAPAASLPRDARSYVLTGVGSSAAHARFLGYLLQEVAGRAARFLPLSAFAGEGPRGSEQDVLIVFSQGLSPNARLALATASRWRKIVLVTAAREGLEEIEAGGTIVVGFPGENEFGTLVRVTGPMTGYWRAVAIARGLGGGLPQVAVERVCERVAAAAGVVDREAPDVGWVDGEVALVTSGGYGGIVSNLQLKFLEGMLRPLPPVWDLLDLAHGPFQQTADREATFVALTRADAPGEPELLARLGRMLEPKRHRLIVLPATLPGPFAIFEHEAMLDEILLRYIRERGVDQVEWPGKGRDAPLYEVDERRILPRQLERLTWPELETLLANGCRTAILPLGATEQHGPHLPFATDSWIAEALAERLCARIPEAIQAPVVTLGCSSEHIGFPGTLSARASTLEAILSDVLGSLRRHGFERVFLFSAHGGNYDLLQSALPMLRKALAPMVVDAFTDLEGLTARLHREGAAMGVSPAAAGHHAGEIEASILLALRPAEVRTTRFAPGLVDPPPDPQSLFYPSLRANAPEGTVGDPRGADASRAGRYLDAWVDLLVESYALRKNRVNANGIQNE